MHRLTVNEFAMKRASKSLRGGRACVQCCHCRGEQLIRSPGLRNAWQHFLARFSIFCHDDELRKSIVNSTFRWCVVREELKEFLLLDRYHFAIYLPSRSPSFYLPLYHVLTLSLSVSLFLSLFLSLIYRLCFSDRPTNNQATPSFVLLSFCTLMRSLSVSSSSTSLSSSTASPLLLSQIILIMYYI